MTRAIHLCRGFGGQARPVRATLHSAEALWCREVGSNIQRLTTNVQKAKKSLPAGLLAGPWPPAVWRLIAMTIRPGSASRATNGSRGTLPRVKDLKAKKKPWPPAVWRLIATHAKLEFELTHWNHNPLTISNRNKKHVSDSAPYSRFANCEPRATHQGFSTRTRGKIELVATRRKQRFGSSSNRGYSRPARRSIWGCGGGGLSARSCPSRITNHESQTTVPMLPVLQWTIRARYGLETAAGAAASKDLGVGKRETE
jgi:hypothetical protein